MPRKHKRGVNGEGNERDDGEEEYGVSVVGRLVVEGGSASEKGQGIISPPEQNTRFAGKAVGDVRANRSPSKNKVKNEGRCPVLRRVGVHDQKSVPKTSQRPQFLGKFSSCGGAHRQ